MKCKRLLGILVALSIILPGNVLWGTAQDDEYVDSFERYTAEEPKILGSGNVLNENWQAYPGEMGYDGNAKAAVRAGVTNQAGIGGQMLSIEARAAADPVANGAHFPTLLYTGAYPSTAGYQVSFKVVTGRGGGLRFAADSDFQNYYELYLRAEGNAASTVYLYKVQNEQRELLYQVSRDEITMSSQVSGLPLWNNVFNVELAYYPGEIAFRVVPASGGPNHWSMKNTVRVIDGDDPLSGGKAALFAAGNSSGGEYTSFDDFAISSYLGMWGSGIEPDNLIYVEVGAGQVPDSQGVIDLCDFSRVRKISLSGMGSNVDVKLSADGENWTDIGTVFRSNSMLLNSVMTDKCRYIKLEGSYETARFYNNMDGAVLRRPVLSRTPLSAYFNGTDQDTAAITWESSNPEAFDVEDGVLVAKQTGEGILQGAYGENIVSFPVSVEKELDYYQSLDMEDVYLANKQSVADAFNAAIRDKDAAAMAEMLRSEAEPSLTMFADIDSARLESLSDAQRAAIGAALAERDPLYGEGEKLSFAHIDMLLQYVDGELSIYDLLGLTDQEEIIKTLEANYAFYQIDASDETFTTYADDICTRLANGDYASLAELQTFYQALYREMWERLLFDTLEDLNNYLTVDGFLQKFASEIGYDADAYAEIEDLETFEKAFIRSKSDMETIEDIRNFVDTYKETASGSTSTSKGGSTSGSRGGGSTSGSGTTGGQVVLPLSEDTESTVPERTSPFRDLGTDHWGFEDIVFLNARGIMIGDENNLMHPDENIARAEFVKILLESLHLMSDEDADAAETPAFSDIEPDDWFYPYMQAAAEQEILLGDGVNCYPDQQLARQELCTLLYRVLNELGIEMPATQSAIAFYDAAAIDSWASHAVMTMQRAGIISGTSEQKFEPARSATRAEAAKVLAATVRLCESVSAQNEEGV